MKWSEYSRGDPLWLFDVNVNFVAGCLRHRTRLRGEEAPPANREHAIQTNDLAIRLFRREIAPEKALFRQGWRVSVAESFRKSPPLAAEESRGEN